MNFLDYFVLIACILGIASYGFWQTRKRDTLTGYIKGAGQNPWYAIGISVMATQASAVTFLSTPGQGFESGLGFVQIYFGVPVALLIISAFFLPVFRKLNVYTAYEFLEKRFDSKTRLLGAGLFLLQRGLGAGLTIYAPAIVLSSVFGWPLDQTIICCGTIVIVYTVAGGSDAVTLTQKYQMAVIFAGMISAACLLIGKLPEGLDPASTLKLAGGFGKLNAVNFTADINERYTIWSGLLGGSFLMLSYFGTDQSQVQRYISGSSLRESRLGLLFNAVCKIPMQFCILFLGVLIFVFYQFREPPLFFNADSRTYLAAQGPEHVLRSCESKYAAAHRRLRQELSSWIAAEKKGEAKLAAEAFAAAAKAKESAEQIKAQASKTLSRMNPAVKASDADYVFITFILNELPHGVIGLLIAAFFAATLSSKSAELNALGTCTTIDFYRHFAAKYNPSEANCLRMSRYFTAFWGILAIAFALYAHLLENLIQAVNILGSIFYGVMLGLFLVAFFIKKVQGTAIFWAALISQSLIFFLYFNLKISYLWFPLIGCLSCVLISAGFQLIFEIGKNKQMGEGPL